MSVRLNRYAMRVAYDGTEYAGWQIQPNALAIQEVLESRLAKIFNAEIRIHGAGRTDAGVHARGQVCHFDAEAVRFPAGIRHAMNGMLPTAIRVLHAWKAAPRFHSRVSAVGKHYRYVLHTGAVVSPFQGRWVWHVPSLSDPEGMAQAAERLIGTHDFLSFSVNPKRVVESTVCTLHACAVSRSLRDPNRILIDLVGDRFLYKMVRSIVGTLVRVGQGRAQPDCVAAILAARNRSAAAQTAPPQGLCMWRVLYPPREPAAYAERLVHAAAR